MTGSAGTAFVDLEPRFSGGFTRAVTQEAQRAGAAGSQILGGFASRTGGIFQTLDQQLAGFGVPFTGQLSTIGSHLQGVSVAEGEAASGAARLSQVGTAAFLGLGAAAVGLGVISAKAFLRGEDATANYDEALRSVGDSHEELDPKIDSTIKKLAQFGIDSDAVQISAGQLTRATKDGAKALDEQTLAADIAAGRRIDLAAANQILIKVETGRVGVLKKLGISTEDATGKTISSEEAIRRLSDLYSGSAAAASETYAGKLRAVGAEVSNLQTEIGGKIVPVVADFGSGLLDGVQALETVNSATDGWLGTLGGTALAATAVLIAVNKIGAGFSLLGGFLSTATGLTEAHTAAEVADAEATTAAAASRVQLAGATAAEVEADATLAGAQAGLFEATTATNVAQAEQLTLFPAVAGEAGVAAAGVGSLAAAEEAAAVSTGVLSGSIAFLRGHLASLGIGGAITAVVGGFILGKKAGDEINASLGGTKPNVDELADSFEILAKTGTVSGEAADQLGGHLEGLAGDLKTIQGSTLEKGFGFAPSAHAAVKDIDATNDALKKVLDTKGPKAAELAFGELTNALLAQGVSIEHIGKEFSPFSSALADAREKERLLTGSSKDLSVSLDELAKKQLARQATQLSIADSFDQVHTAEEALAVARADEAGTGKEAVSLARQEKSARDSLSSAIESQTDAARSLGEAQAELAEFDSPTDQRVRVLEHLQITDRVVTTPEEARQKEIDLLQFDERNSDRKADLQKRVADAERGVEDATERVADAQVSVRDATAARATFQTEAAGNVEAAERKVKEAVIAVALELDKAAQAGQINNTQLQAYLTLLDAIADRTDPNGVLAKNLDGIIERMALAVLLKASRPPAGPEGPGGPVSVGVAPVGGAAGQPGTALSGPQSGPDPTGGLGGLPGGKPNAAPSVHIDARSTNHIHGNDMPTSQELDVLNKKQAIRISAAITGGRH